MSSPGATGSPSQPNAGKRKKLPVDSVFDKFDDEEADEQPRKRKLVPLDYDDDKSLGVDGAGLSSIKGANAEEKRKHIKSLIEKIPTAKPELFSYPLDWSMVDTVRRGGDICRVSLNFCVFVFFVIKLLRNSVLRILYLGRTCKV